jgi:hypothetical protein
MLTLRNRHSESTNATNVDAKYPLRLYALDTDELAVIVGALRRTHTESTAATTLGMTAALPPLIAAKPAARLARPASDVGNRMLFLRTLFIAVQTRNLLFFKVETDIRNMNAMSHMDPPASHLQHPSRMYVAYFVTRNVEPNSCRQEKDGRHWRSAADDRHAVRLM